MTEEGVGFERKTWSDEQDKLGAETMKLIGGWQLFLFCLVCFETEIAQDETGLSLEGWKAP